MNIVNSSCVCLGLPDIKFSCEKRRESAEWSQTRYTVEKRKLWTNDSFVAKQIIFCWQIKWNISAKHIVLLE